MSRNRAHAFGYWFLVAFLSLSILFMLVGLPPIPVNEFVAFNLTWLAVWLLAIGGVRRGVVIAVWPLWFLGLAAVLNVVAHPILALISGAYFPGFLTSPLVGAAGIFLLRELVLVTSVR
jgi:hypothetical protein